MVLGLQIFEQDFFCFYCEEVIMFDEVLVNVDLLINFFWLINNFEVSFSNGKEEKKIDIVFEFDSINLGGVFFKEFIFSFFDVDEEIV